jgi:hypothetical protein
MPVIVEFFDEDVIVTAALEAISDLVSPGHVLTFAADLS